MIRAAALGLALVVTIALVGCGIVVTDEAPTYVVQASAPALVQAFPEVDALVPASTRTLAVGRARQIARRAALQFRIPGCGDDRTGRGFALDAHTLIAHRDALPGAGSARVSTANRPLTAVGSASAFRVGELGVARVTGRLPRTLPLGRSIAAGASVVAVAERNGKLRMLPGVIVDSVPGAPYGARTKVLRVTSAVEERRRRPRARRQRAHRGGRDRGRPPNEPRGGDSRHRTPADVQPRARSKRCPPATTDDDFGARPQGRLRVIPDGLALGAQPS